MKTTRVSLSDNKDVKKIDGGILVCFVSETEDKKINLFTEDISIKNKINAAHKIGDFSGKEGETLLFYEFDCNQEKSNLNDSEDGTKTHKIKDKSIDSHKRILAVGIGRIKIDSSSKLHTYDEFIDILRKAGGTIASTASKVKAAKICVSIPDIDPVSIKSADTAQYLAEGILLGDYRFLKYKKEKKDEPEYKGISEVRFFLEQSSDISESDSSKLNLPKTIAEIRKALKLAVSSAQAVCEARDMANEPGNFWRASEFADYAEKLAKKYNLNCTVLDKAQMKKLGMGGIIAVNQGSSEPPKMVILEYLPKELQKVSKTDKDKNKPQKSKNMEQSKHSEENKIDTILLVGKGITFDSGGICLKQPSGMEDMKYDMCGGAAVLAVMQAAAQESPENIKVVAIIPATDNLSGSNAIKPGDVIRHYNGVTSEIVNTDAEGRMILADALSYGIEKFKPACVIDIATLTGAVIMGLGHHYSAVLGNNDELIKRLEKAGKRAAEPLWRLPLGKEYAKQIESKIADIKNTGGKSAGTITAASYLENFVDKTPWAHIDIAGTAWDFTEKTYIPKGPSGIGVRTFLEMIRSWHTIF